MDKNKSQSGSANSIAAVIVVVVLSVLGFVYWQKNMQPTDYTTTDTNSSQNTDNTKTTPTGFIEGSLTYPSEGIPDSLVVIAKNIDTGQEYSTSEHLSGSGYSSGVGYKIQVPVGNYYVYGVFEGSKAYYNQFVVCGMAVECTDLTKVVVTVTNGGTTSNITVGDWYNPEQ